MTAMFMLLLVFLRLVHGSSADCSYGQIRLVNGTAPNEGLVEICINSTWGTVCDDFWSNSNAEVVCRQLGYSTNGSMSGYFGTGYGEIFLDDVVCGGFESSLLHCSHNFIGTHNCIHAEDIGVICSNCSDGDLRLINGSVPNEGRVEICINNTWGTVCDRNWTNASADVVCKQLGYNTTGAVYSFFGGGSGDIFVSDVNCIGFENTLLECKHNLTNLTDCNHQNDVGVICLISGCYDGQLRLVNGSVPNEGRLEVCYNNTWGTVCDHRWTNIVADVVCRQLGYSIAGAVYRFNNAFGQGNRSIFLNNIQCRGFERSLLHCSHGVVGDSFCRHADLDVGVICLDIDPSDNETLCSTELDNELWDTMRAQGKCEPYIDRHPWSNPSVCDNIYTSLHYVYTPNARLLGQPYVRLFMEYITVNFTFTPQCYESVVNALCGLYYLPCGYNGTIQVPRFFCSDACTNVSTQMCSDDWDALRSFVIAKYSGGQDQVWDETIIMPNCSNTDLFIEAFDLDDDCCEPSYLPGPVYNLMASDVTNTSVTLSWSFNDNSPITGGVVAYAAVSNGFGNGMHSFTGGHVMEQIIFNLEPFTVYNFSVTVLNTFGSSSKVTINTETLPNVPTAPTLNSAVSINLTSISVSWRSNIDPLTQSEVELYTVMYYTEGQNNELNVTAPATIVTINGLAEKKNYSVTVSATNSAGKSASSNFMTVQTNSYACNTETTVSSDRGTFGWPVTTSGSVANVSCPSGPTGANATRICTNDNTWESPNITSCATTRISNEFRNISNVNITAENIVSVSGNLTDLLVITTDPADQNNDNIQVVSIILTRTATLLSDPMVLLSLSSSELSMTTENIVQILDIVEEWSLNVVETESNNIINSFEGIIDALINQENFTNITVVEDDIALIGKRFQQSTFSGTVFTAASSVNALEVEIKEDNTNGLNINETASIELPQNIINIVEDDNIDLAFTLYNKSVLFPVREPPPNTIVGSSVIGARINGVTDGTKLPDPVVINLALKRIANITNPRCVYWDFNAAGGRGNWSTDGCNTTVNTTNGHIACHCDHLTNFACLVDVSARSDGATQAPKYFTITLEVVSIVGVCLSIVGLVLTIITLIIFKKLRTKETSRFHIQLCLSLIFMLVVFVAGIDRVSVRAGCITVGVLIHYFALVAWMWMGAEALLMFQKLVIVFSNITWKYIIAVSIVCWTLPILPVAITLAVDRDFYIYLYENGNQTGFCFINNMIPFLVAFLLPVLIILVFNGVIYVLIIRVSFLHTVDKNKRMNKSPLTKSEVLRMLLSYSGILILFGLTWLFGVFTFITEPNVSFVVQFFFAFFNTFQGFFIFFFFVILSSDSRNTWISLLCPRTARKGKTSLTSTAAKTKSSNVKVTSPLEKKPHKNENEISSNGKENMHLEEQNENLIFGNKIILEDSVLSTDDEFMISEFSTIRFERQLTTRRKHLVEKIEIDFFDADNESLLADDDDDN